MIQVKDDIEAGADMNGDVLFRNLDFTEKTIRRGFIRKVYGILMVQLATTLAFVSVFVFVEPVKLFVYEQGLIFLIVALVAMLVTMIAMFCFTSVRRKAPGNYIFLGIFTLALSLMVGVAAIVSERDEVFMALGICAVVTLALTLFAWQTKYDFTMCHTTLFTLLTLLCLVGLSAFFIDQTRLVQLIFAGFGAFVYSLLLIYDTQLIIGGNHKLAISPEEYVFAALTLYVDIIGLFLRILRILRLA